MACRDRVACSNLALVPRPHEGCGTPSHRKRMSFILLTAESMQRINEYDFYALAASIHPLTELENSGTAYVDKWYLLYDARRNLEALSNLRPFHVCLNASWDLLAAINAIVPKEWKDALDKVSTEKALTPPPVIPAIQIYRVSSAATNFETVLAAEVATMDTYFVSQKGSYKTQDLIDRAQIMFPENIRKDLPDRTIEDIKAAGRCFVLDCPTAAGFHILRGVESVLALYYQHVIGKPIPTLMRNWGVYIKKLRRGGASKKIVQMLQHIKDEYRNPTLHPEEMLNSDEVEVLLGICNSVIRMMILEMSSTAPAAVPALPPPSAIPGLVPGP
jgi:hypothetical protein